MAWNAVTKGTITRQENMVEKIVDMVTKLATPLAWPLVAILALIVLAPQLRYVVRLPHLVDELRRIVAQVSEMDIQRLENMQKSLEAIKSSFDELALEQVEKLTQQDVERFGETQDGGRNRDAMAGDGDSFQKLDRELTSISNEFAHLSPEQLRNEIDSHKQRLNSELTQAWNRCRISGSLISPRFGALKLADNRRINPLKESDVDAIDSLTTKHRSYMRIQRPVEQWLTLEEVSLYVKQVRDLIPKLQNVSNRMSV